MSVPPVKPSTSETPLPETVRETPFLLQSPSEFRARVIRSLNGMPRGRAFCVVTTCDISSFEAFEYSCRQRRVRPPSLYAYVARCLGKTLQGNTHLLASRYGKKFLVPSSVQLRIAVEVTGFTDEKTPMMLMFKDVGRRDLPDIAREMSVRLREARRNKIPPPLVRRRFVPSWSPTWWQNFVQYLRENRPRHRYARACSIACAQLSSTSQWTGNHAGWGIPMFTPCALTVMLGGVTKRPVVVGNEIVARLCVDVTITFDHDITDGAPATRYVRSLSEEIESGRLLQEYDLTREPPTSSTRSSENMTDELIDKSNSAYNENPNDAARYNESRA